MKTPPNSEQLERFAASLVKLIGLRFDASKFGELDKVLQNRMQANGVECDTYLVRLAATQSGEELGQLARELTVTETYFMRNSEQIDALLGAALPACLDAAAATRPLQLLSAACASGEEPYSLAIALRESFPQLTSVGTITAVDLNPAMLQKAAQARYGEWSLRVCPAAVKSRWFSHDSGAWQLDKTIRDAVKFETLNLAHDAPEFWRAARFDVIFCRNVLMYFSAEKAQAAIARMHRALTPGGYLFLGHAETLRGLSNDFHLRHTHGAFYYQRKDGPVATDHPVEPLRSERQSAVVLLPDNNWFEAIERASKRITVLASGNDVNRYDNARNSATAPEQVEVASDPDALLLKAITASHNGSTAEAESACTNLLQTDELSAGAHYILALCHESRGEVDAALEHDRIAVYLDANFAMPQLHIGLLTRRQGEINHARRELNAALNLLRLEDPARLLLFGGGFKREALIALCKAELAALGEAP